VSQSGTVVTGVAGPALRSAYFCQPAICGGLAPWPPGEADSLSKFRARQRPGLAPASVAGHADEAGRLGADDDASERQAFARTLEGTTTAQ
jgi:hypothetical protein